MKFNPFGRKARSYGLIHILLPNEEFVCGDYSQYGPPLNVDDSEVTTCLTCLVDPDGVLSSSSQRT